MNTKLGKFEGRVVGGSLLKVTGTIDNRVGALGQDEEVYVVAKVTVARITHGDVSEVYTRQHTGKAGQMVIIEPEVGERWLTEAQMLADERFGIANLFAQADEALGHKDGDDEEGKGKGKK